MSHWSWFAAKHFSRVNLSQQIGTDFFPSGPVDLGGVKRICLGTKSRALGDAVLLTALPERLKRANPRLKVQCYIHAFNPVVFANNPFVDSVSLIPTRVYGDDANWGVGHLIQQKEQFFGIEPSENPRPRIYLTPAEIEFGKRETRPVRPDDQRPFCVIHPWGKTNPKVAGLEYWSETVARWNHKIRFWQIGIEGQVKIPGCEHAWFGPKIKSPSGLWLMRQDFAILSQAELFIGVDSGPMHLARAFEVPSLILVNLDVSVEDALRKRHGAPYFLYRNFQRSFIYESNRHLDVPRLSPEQIRRQTDEYLESFLCSKPLSSRKS